MIALFDEFLVPLARNSAAAAVLAVLVLLVQWLFRRQLSPQWRCALWLLVVARLLPFAPSSPVSVFNLFPRWSGETGVTQASPAAAPTRSAPIAPTLDSATLRKQTSPLPGAGNAISQLEVEATPAGQASASPIITWQALLVLSWLAGTLVLATYVAVVALSFRRVLSRAKPLNDHGVLALLAKCCDQMGVRRAPIVVESTAIQTPALHGVFRPRLLLPAGFTTTFSAEELRFVFLHELAHLRRHDLLLNWIMTILQILHWFNPLVWYSFARWRIDREVACDSAALAASDPRSNRAYGQTMLRLLEHVSLARRQPGLVGILEDKRQLHRRMKMIAGFTPPRRSLAAAGLFLILAIVGLTDARVGTALGAAAPGGAGAPAISVRTIPLPDAPYVLLLVNASETMLGAIETPPASGTESRPFAERGRAISLDPQNSTDEQKRAAPKWLRARQVVEQTLLSLPAQTDFQVVIFFDHTVEVVGGRIDATDALAVPDALARLGDKVPRGVANLESALGSIASVPDRPNPERIVLITDGLPTASGDSPAAGEVSEAERIQNFTKAMKRLPPRIPVHTILVPTSAGDPGAAGLYWGLANATRGQLTTAASPGVTARTHLAFVIDTSGSMRDPNNGGVWPAVITALEASLDLHPELVGLQLIDGDGRFILPRRGTGAAGWLPNTPETRETMRTVLRKYNQDTVSNPVPGIRNALRFLYDKAAPEMRMGIYVFGDEFNSSEPAGIVLDRIEALNPRDANGRRPVTISAIGFPTTIRYQFSMGNTGLRFANLMRQLTHEHDGSFVALPDL
jgi:beta-lactamase regulating signal transducer with metallopeptidase domain